MKVSAIFIDVSQIVFAVVFSSRAACQKIMCRTDGRELPYTAVAPQAFTVSTSPTMNIASF